MLRGRRSNQEGRPRSIAHGSLLQPRGGQHVPGGGARRVLPHQVHQGGPGHLGGQHIPELPQVCLLGLAAAGRVCPDPRLPTSPNSVILGITAVTVLSSPARCASSWAYPAMNRWVSLAAAYPPLAGDPLMAAPLLTITTLLPGGSGRSSASRSQLNAILTSVCQLTENVSHVWYWSGRGHLGECRAGPGDGDHRGAGLGERLRDSTPQPPAGADDHSGPARQVTRRSRRGPARFGYGRPWTSRQFCENRVHDRGAVRSSLLGWMVGYIGHPQPGPERPQ